MVRLWFHQGGWSTSEESAHSTSEETDSQSELMKSVTKLIEAQVLAMAQAASLQSLPPLCSCTGVGRQTDEDGVEWWLWKGTAGWLLVVATNLPLGIHKTWKVWPWITATWHQMACFLVKKSELLEPLDCHKRYLEPNLHIGNVKLTEGWNASSHQRKPSTCLDLAPLQGHSYSNVTDGNQLANNGWAMAHPAKSALLDEVRRADHADTRL